MHRGRARGADQSGAPRPYSETKEPRRLAPRLAPQQFHRACWLPQRRGRAGLCRRAGQAARAIRRVRDCRAQGHGRVARTRGRRPVRAALLTPRAGREQRRKPVFRCWSGRVVELEWPRLRMGGRGGGGATALRIRLSRQSRSFNQCELRAIRGILGNLAAILRSRRNLAEVRKYCTNGTIGSWTVFRVQGRLAVCST